MKQIDILEWERQGLVSIGYSVRMDREVKPVYCAGQDKVNSFLEGKTSWSLSLQYEIRGLLGDTNGGKSMSLSLEEAKVLLDHPTMSLEELMTILCVHGYANVWHSIEDTIIKACTPEYEISDV